MFIASSPAMSGQAMRQLTKNKYERMKQISLKGRTFPDSVRCRNAGNERLEMLSKLRTELPNLAVIFVSAYKRAEFIQKAIRLDALDYLDKPVDPFELECSLNKVFQRKSISIESTKEIERFRLLTKAGDMFVEVHEVIYFNSDGRYSIAYLADGKPVQVRENLEALSKKLPAEYFLRVSRHHIIS